MNENTKPTTDEIKARYTPEERAQSAMRLWNELNAPFPAMESFATEERTLLCPIMRKSLTLTMNRFSWAIFDRIGNAKPRYHSQLIEWLAPCAGDRTKADAKMAQIKRIFELSFYRQWQEARDER